METFIFDNLIEKVVGGVANMALGAAKSVTNDFMKDTPSIKVSDAANMALTNIPRNVTSLGVVTEDLMPEVSEVVSLNDAKVHDMTDIVQRCKVLSRRSIVNWSATQPTGTLLFSCPVTPTTSNTVADKTMESTMLSFFSQFYTFWRGGLRFTVECLPSKFHQGQLYLSFNPNLATPSLPLSRNCTSATIDLGENNRTSLDIPYVTVSDYLKCVVFNESEFPATMSDSLGTFNVFVQNELDSSGTVANNIDFNVYIECLDDFEFKVPRSLTPAVKVYFQGTYQMDEEVVRNSEAVPTYSGPNVKVATNVENAAVVTNVRTADTDNVMSREYMMAYGLTATTLQTVGTAIYNSLYPSTFFSVDLATSGLFSYHELYRMDFKFTVRVNPTPFNQGALMLVWIPGNIEEPGLSLGTYTQFPHAILNVASETSASVVVPFSSMVRMLRGTYPDMGALRVIIWNQIKAPTAAPQNLKFSVWAQALDVHMAVKRQAGAQGVLQGDLSDTAKQTATQQVAFAPQTQSKGGFMTGKHDNVLTYMRRFMFVGRAPIRNSALQSELPATWYTPVFCGREHVFMKETYAFSTGSQRLMIGSNYSRSTTVTGFVVPIWNDQRQATLGAATSVANLTYSSFLTGASQFNPYDPQQRIFEFPYFSIAPLVPANHSRLPYGNAWPTAYVAYKDQQGAANVSQSFMWHAVGDDFMVYYPVAVSNIRYVPVVAAAAAKVGSVELASEDIVPGVDLALSGDIESNPGPDVEDDVCLCGSCFACMFDRRIAAMGDPETRCWCEFDFYGRVTRQCVRCYPFVEPENPVVEHFDIDDLPEDSDDDEDEGFGDESFEFEYEVVVEEVPDEVECDLLLQCGDVESNPGPYGIKEAATAVCESLPAFTEAATAVKEAMPHFAATASSVKLTSDECTRTANMVTEFLDGFKKDPTKVVGSVASQFMEKAQDVLTLLLDTLTHLYNLYKGGTARALSAMALIAKYSKYLGSQLLKKLESVATSMGIFQGFSDFTMAIALAPAIIGGVLALFGQEFGGDDTQTFRFRLNEELEEAKGVQGTVAAVFKVIVEYIFEGTGWGVQWYALSHHELVKFVKEVDDAKVAKTYTILTVKNVAVKEKLNKLLKLAKKIRVYGPTLPRFNLLYVKAADEVIEWSKLATKSDQCSRVPTIGVAFEGKTAVGKSFLASNVVPAILLMKLDKAKTAEEALTMIWNKPTGAETHFYDGYTQQPVAYIDDFLKTVEAKDALDAINIISSSAYTVDMAALENKGMMFKSDFLVVTTNSPNFAAVHGLTCAAALCSRFKHAVRVTVSNAGMSGSEAVEAFTKEVEGLKTLDALIDTTAKYWTLYPLDVNGGTVGSQPVGFRWFIEDIMKTYKQNVNSYDRLLRAFRGISQGSVSSEYVECLEEGLDMVEQCMDEIVLSYKDTLFNPFFQDMEPTYRKICIDRLTEKGVVKGRVLDLANQDNWRGITEGDVLASLSPPAKKWKGLLKVLAGVGIAAALGWGLYRLLNSSITAVVGMFQGKAYDSVKPRPKTKANGIVQGVDERLERIRKNLRKIEIHDVDNDASLGRMYGLLLGGKRILIPRHFWTSLSSFRKAEINCFMRIEKRNPRGEFEGWIRVGYEAALCAQVKTDDGELLDLCVVHMHNVNVNGARHIHQFIPTKREHRGLLCNKEVAGRVLSEDDVDDVGVHLGRREPIAFTSDSDVESVFMVVAELPKGMSTEKGDCGKPYVLLDSACSKPLVGLHSARITSMSGSPAGCTPLVFEWIQKAEEELNLLVKNVCIQSAPHPEGDGTKSGYWQSNIHCEGRVQHNGVDLNVFPLKKTDYVPWLAHENWNDNYAPSAKGYNEERHSLYSNAQKHEVKATAIVPFRVHKMCVDHYAKKFENDRDRAVFTDHEMVNGKGAMTALVMNTSCGFMSKWFKDGKKEIFDQKIDGLNAAEYTFSEVAKTRVVPLYGSSFTEHLKKVENDLKEGEVPFMVWVATLKDELRPIAKVKGLKTRVFEQPPLELTLLLRKHFGAFLNWVKTHHGALSHSAIGIDKESVWRDYWLLLREKGLKGFDVDYSNYDGSVCSQAFDFFRDVVDAYYGNTCPIRHGLLYALQNAWIIVGDYLVFTEQGNKSGNPMTDVFNSITNVYVIYLSYLQGRAKIGKEQSLKDFDRDVACLTYGDDVICSTGEGVEAYFNRVVVADLADLLGMKVTAADKGDTLIPLQDLRELTFLKSKFVENGSLVMAPMPADVAIRELQFIKKRNRGDRRIKGDIVENAMRFTAHAGRKAVEALRRELADIGVESTFSYEDFILEMLEKQSV